MSLSISFILRAGIFSPFVKNMHDNKRGQRKFLMYSEGKEVGATRIVYKWRAVRRRPVGRLGAAMKCGKSERIWRWTPRPLSTTWNRVSIFYWGSDPEYLLSRHYSGSSGGQSGNVGGISPFSSPSYHFIPNAPPFHPLRSPISSPTPGMCW